MLTDFEPHAVPAEVCPEIALKVAETRSEREAAFQLIHHAYCRAGLCSPASSGLRITPYQLLPTTEIFIAKLHGEVISTLTLVRDGALGLPLEEIYPDEVASRRSAGQQLAEVSCLADRRQEPARFFPLFCELSRLMAQLAAQLGVTELLAAVHPRHAPLYRRHMVFRPIGERRDYPTVCGNPAIALSLDFSYAARETPRKWQEFFGQPLPSRVLRSCPISATDRHYFQSLEDCRSARNRNYSSAIKQSA